MSRFETTGYSKGSAQRPVNRKKFEEEYDRIFAQSRWIRAVLMTVEEAYNDVQV